MYDADAEGILEIFSEVQTRFTPIYIKNKQIKNEKTVATPVKIFTKQEINELNNQRKGK